MASRRQLLGASIAQGGQDLVQLIVRQLFAQQQAAYEDQLQRERQKLLADQTAQNSLLNRAASDPATARRVQQSNPTIAGVPTSAFIPSDDEILGDMTKELEGTKDLGALPSQLSLQAQAQAKGLDTTKLPPQLATLMDIRNSVESRLQKNQPTTRVEGIDPTTLGPTQRFVPNSQLASLGETPSGLNPEQKGKAFVREQFAGPLNSGYVNQKVAAANQEDEGTRISRGLTERMLAGQRERGRLEPDLINARVDEDARKAKNQASAQGTDTERAKANLAVQMLMTAEEMKKYESQGASAGNVSLSSATNPLAASIFDTVGKAVPYVRTRPLDKSYADAAVRLANLRVFQLSGATATEKEFGRFLSSLVHLHTDTPEQRAAKSMARDAMIQAINAALGPGGASSGGKVLGMAIAKGQVSPDVLKQVDFTPEFLAGVKSVLPVF